MGVTKDAAYAEANRLLLDNGVHGIKILSVNDRKALIDTAAREYSRKRPNLAFQAYTGISDNWYTLPTSWEQGFSSIKEIEYRIEQTPKAVLDSKDYYVSMMSDGSSGGVRKLRFDRNNPSTGETFWIKYHVRHIFDTNGNSDIAVADQTGFSYLILAVWCDALATHYASKADPSLPNAEVIATRTRSEEYNSKAKDFRKLYEGELMDENLGQHGGVGFLQNPYWDRDDE